MLDTCGLQTVHQLLAHCLDAHAHAGELLLPNGAQLGAVQHRGDHSTAMNGRVGVVGANDDLELAQDAVSFFLVFAEHRQGTDTLAVKAEALAERGGDEKIQPGGGEFADDRAVFRNAVAKALVRHVQKRHEFVALDGGDHLVPLGSGDVVTGGVMAAGVQQDDGAGGRSSQVSQHAVEVHTALGCIVVAVVFNRETGAGE